MQKMAVREKGQRVRGCIIDAANRLFYERGYNQTSFSDIADAADIPRGNFYYHFKSKQEILSAVIDDRMESIAAMLDEWNAVIGEPLERLKRFVDISLNEEKDLMRYGCPMGSLNMELLKNHPDLQSQAGRMFDCFLEWLQTQFTALGKADAAHSLAMRLLGEMQGVALIASVYKDRDYLSREVRRLKRWLDEGECANE